MIHINVKFLDSSISQIKRQLSLPRSLATVFLLGSVALSAQNRIVKISVDLQDEVAQYVGIMGSESPLSWDEPFLLSDEDGDGVFEADVTFNTSKKYLKFKFVKDGKQELDGSDNRILWFAGDSQNVTLTFNEFEFYDADQLAKLTLTEEQIKEDVNALSQIIQYIHPAIYKYLDSLALQVDLIELQTELLANPDLVNAYKAISKFAALV